MITLLLKRSTISICIFLVFTAWAVPVMAQAPTATTNAAIGIGATGATVNGTVNANGSSTTIIFEYGLTEEYGQSVTAVPSPISGSAATPVTGVVTGLDPSTTYHYRVVATNASGTTNGADMTFTTTAPSGNPPGATTNAATGIGADTATLNGQVISWSVDTIVVFQWGTDTNYGNSIAADQSPVNSGGVDAVTATLTSLANNSTYHYRVVASNINGTTFGNDMTFAIGSGGAAPTVTTNAATSIGSVSATLNGTVNANGDSTTVTFEYGLDTNYGSISGASPSPVSGSTNTSVSQTLSALLPNTTYHYRVVGTNSNGTTNGTDMQFTTLPLAPTATTGAASLVTGTTATLNGTVNANDGSTAVTFEYGPTVAYGSTVAGTPSPVTGGTDTAVSSAISGLTDGVTYHYRVVAVNAGGTTFGADMTFTTGATAPTATTNAASGIAGSSATFNGTINANGSSTTVTFEYGETTAYGRSISAAQSPVTGSTNTAVSGTVSDLVSGTVYHFRVVASSVGGTTYGADLTFTAGGQPTVTTGAATGVDGANATLNGTVNANNDSTTVTFEYGLTTAYGSTVTADQSPVTGNTATAVSKAISGLTNNTTYHYRVVGQNGSGTSYGADMTFTTATPAVPTVTTDAATFVIRDGATLNGTVNANNNSTTVTFEYGLTAAYGSTVTADESPVGGAVDTAVSATISGLTNTTTYHYRVVGSNSEGTTNGADMTFTTGGDPVVVTEAATNVTASNATVNGSVNANYVNTSFYFDIGFTTSYGYRTGASPFASTGNNTLAVSLDLPVALEFSLAPATTYHYRVVAINGLGEFPGADMTFTTDPTVAPTGVTDAATSVGSTFATLNGTVNPGGFAYLVDFEYGLTAAYGSTVTGNPNYISGSVDTASSASITSLVANTTYHYRVVVKNSFFPYAVVVNGADMTFTTATPPTAVTDPESAVGTNSATLNGTVNSNGGSSTVTFQWGLDTNYGNTVIADQDPVTGGTNTAVSNTLGTLTPNTTYHYRVVATKGSDIVNGADETFTTGIAPPSADTSSASGVTASGATLNGIVNANNDDATVTFEYGTTVALGTSTAATPSPVTGASNTAVSATLGSLNPNTVYYYRVSAQNTGGTTVGTIMNFFTGTAAPTVTTGTASVITSTGATLNGTVNANNGATTVTFEYGPTIAYGQTLAADQSPLTGSTDTAVSVATAALAPNTTYHFRTVGQNSAGTTYGLDQTFTTNAGGTPVVITGAVSGINANTAQVDGNVTNEGDAPVTARGVCWSTVTAPTTADSFTVNGTGAGTFTGNLTGLTTSTVYYVRAYATNVYGTAYGNEVVFTTNAASTPTVDTSAVSDITSTSATSGGNVTDNGGSAVTARGVCWSTAPNPTIANNRTANGSGNGAFTSYLTNLSKDTMYYVRAYATNAVGTGYGAQRSFTTASATVTVTITHPAHGETVGGTVSIAADVAVNRVAAAGTSHTKANTVDRVEFYIDGNLLDTDTTSPYSADWDTTAETDGSYTILVMAYDNDGNSGQDSVTVTVYNPVVPGGPAGVLLNRDYLNFAAIHGTTTFTGPQTLLIDKDGTGTLEWSLSFTSDWLACTPASGDGAAMVTVSVDPTGLAAGQYTDTITVVNNATDGTATLPVTLTVYPSGTTSAPFGEFATPVNGSTVMSSIPVTGWVLDDIGVANVSIYRKSVSGEGGGMIYIGDAVMVDGARPDVESAYPDYPYNYQAGWGYMLLTNFLPNGGNGTYTLYAKATDMEGNTVTLGSKTITADNANAVKPFGAIDTPSQGGMASGSSYVNFGWALTPQPNTIPTDGSTITVWVDSKPLGNPVYNQYRADIATLFPGYNNSDGAVGYFYLDTTAYSNGVHTIEWSVKDDAGNKDGIGSRYFTIFNEGGSYRTSAQSSMVASMFGTGDMPAARPGLKTGDTILKPQLSIKELQHVEFQVAEGFTFIHGYLDVNGSKRPLPIGSTLDTRDGRFYWSPSAAFLGHYKLVFVIGKAGGQECRTVDINILPKFEK